MQHMMYDARWPGIPPSVWKEAKMRNHLKTDIIQYSSLRYPGDAQTPNIKPNGPRETRIVLSSRERTVNTTNTHMIRSTIQTKPDRKEKQSTKLGPDQEGPEWDDTLYPPHRSTMSLMNPCKGTLGEGARSGWGMDRVKGR